MVIAIKSINKLEIHQMNVKITFLNDDLDKEIYMEQLEMFIVKEKENKVCKLIKALYDLKQVSKY
jgi:DNA polymerase zeta